MVFSGGVCRCGFIINFQRLKQVNKSAFYFFPKYSWGVSPYKHWKQQKLQRTQSSQGGGDDAAEDPALAELHGLVGVVMLGEDFHWAVPLDWRCSAWVVTTPVADKDLFVDLCVRVCARVCVCV